MHTFRIGFRFGPEVHSVRARGLYFAPRHSKILRERNGGSESKQSAETCLSEGQAKERKRVYERSTGKDQTCGGSAGV